MTAQPPALNPGEWLTLDQASRQLGVHPATLRRWADRGAIATFVTPGGHRRFRRSDVEKFERQRWQVERSQVGTQWTDLAIAHAREEIANDDLFAVYDEGERQAQRVLGRRLLGIVLQYAAGSNDEAGLLAEARDMGERYARLGFAHEQSLSDMLRVIGLFKNALFEAALGQPTGGRAPRGGDGGRLLLRIGRLFDEVQLGVVRFYESQSRA